MNFDDYESVKYWRTSLVGVKERTWNHYKLCLKQFCEWLGKTPDQLLEERKADLKSEDQKTQRKTELVLKAFIVHLEEKGLVPTSLQYAYSAIRSFYDRNFVSLKLFRNDAPSGEAIKERRVPLKDELRKICALATLRDRFLIKLAKDSGLRIGDIVTLKYGDVKEDFEAGKEFINIRVYTKKKKIRASSFIGPEVVEDLKLYLEQRRKGTTIFYYNHLKKGVPPEEITDESPLVRSEVNLSPITVAAAWKAINNLAKAADVKGISPHSFRRYFQTNIEAGGVDPNWRRIMMGKKVRSEEEGYSRPTTEMLREAYKRAYGQLAISEQVIGLSELEEAKRKIDELTLELGEEGATRVYYEDRLRELEVQMKNFEEFLVAVLEKGRHYAYKKFREKLKV